jgi:5-methylcytosine-specific restriction endonuclease McrA
MKLPKYTSHKKHRSKQAQLDVLQRDGRCIWCGSTTALVGHHIASWGSSGNDNSENIVTLCGGCHRDVHQGYLDQRKYYYRDKATPLEEWHVWHADEVLKDLLDYPMFMVTV